MPKSDTLITVISYENAQYTLNAISRLCDQSHPVDVVLWDNNSSKPVRNQLEAANFPKNITCEFSKENLLWTPAINRAMSNYAEGYEYVGFMNNDIYMQSYTVEGLIELLQYDPVGIVGPMGSRLGGISDYATWSTRAEQRGISIEEFRKAPLRGTYLIGACCLLKYDTWKQVGELDEAMPLGADDHDYSIRIRDAGYQIWADPRYPVDHVGHATGQSKNWNKWGQVSWDAFNTKWEGYYRTRAEAIICHWNGVYIPGWDVGTGWLSDEDREPIYELRQELHEQNMEFETYQNIFTEEKWNGGY